MIIVMGAPGAGKTTVLAEAVKKLPGYKVLVYGDLMFEIAKRMNLVSHKDEIRKLDMSSQKKIQAEVSEALSKEGRNTILDTHCSVNTPRGYLPGLPFSLLSKLSVERLVLVDAPAADIARRRVSDTTRVRDSQSNEQLEEHARVNTAFLCAYSAYTGAPMALVHNADGKMQDAVEHLVKVVLQ